VRLFELISHDQFSRIDPSILGDQVLVRWDARDPGSACVELMVEHQLVRGEAQTFGATKSCHDDDKLLVDDSHSLRGGRIRERNRRDTRGRVVGH